MATRIMTIRSCDECGADDSSEDSPPIETFTITRHMNNGRDLIMEMDLCEECGAGFEATYSEIWRRPSKNSVKATPKVPLPDDGWEWNCSLCDFKAANKQGLGNHMARKHS